MARGTLCVAHKHRSLVPIEWHHVWPLGYHGPNTTANKIPTCSNTHGNIHYYMEALFKSGGTRPPNWRTYGDDTRYWAKKGYDQVMAYAERLANESSQST